METQEISKQWEYHAQGETLSSPELGEYHTYVIQVNKTEEGARSIVSLLHDVAADQQLAEDMAALFTLHQLSPIHLQDVVDDMLP